MLHDIFITLQETLEATSNEKQRGLPNLSTQYSIHTLNLIEVLTWTFLEHGLNT